MAIPSTSMSTRVTLLSAKGAFSKPASENVGVDVEDALPGVRTGVENESEFAVRVFARKIVGNGHQFGEECWVTSSKFNNVRVRLGLGHNQQVNRRAGRDVTERDNHVRLENDVGRDVAGDDGGENTH